MNYIWVHQRVLHHHISSVVHFLINRWHNQVRRLIKAAVGRGATQVSSCVQTQTIPHKVAAWLSLLT